MLLRTAVRIIWHEKEKFAGAVAGVTVAVFLMILQWGFYLGFCRDITVVLDSIDADVWVVPRNQPLFDGWLAIDDLPYWQMRRHPDVYRAARVVWGYAAGRLPAAGGTDTVEVLGVEFESGVRLRLGLPPGDVASLVRPDGHVLLGEKDREKFGIDRPGVEGLEINGSRAVPVGFVPEVHLFTTAAFVLTDLDNGRHFLRVPATHATYLVAKCRPGADVGRVVAELRRAAPEHDVLTSRQFHDRASLYWRKRTGVGPVLLTSSALAASVGFLIVMLAFYISTVEKLPVFACLKALGASNAEVVLILVCQALIVFLIGFSLAGAALYLAVRLLAQTTVSVVITPDAVLTGFAATAAVSAVSSLLSVRRVLATDPGEAFRA
jgi:putative ABC transport system permease protein